MQEVKRFCPAVWLSGFFALGFVVHLFRLIVKASLVINGKEISLSTSGWLVVVFGLLSITALYIGLKRPCCDSKK